MQGGEAAEPRRMTALHVTLRGSRFALAPQGDVRKYSRDGLPSEVCSRGGRSAGRRYIFIAPLRALRPMTLAARLPALRRGVLAGATWHFPLAPARACVRNTTLVLRRPASSSRTARSDRRAGSRGSPSARSTLLHARRAAASCSAIKTPHERAPREQDGSNLRPSRRVWKKKPKNFYS